MSDKNDMILGGDALQVLENPAFKVAVKKIADYLEAQAVTCDPHDKDRAYRIVLFKQANAKYLKELERLMKEGQRATPKLVEKKRIFNRGL